MPGQHIAICFLQQENNAGQPEFLRLSLAEYVAVEAETEQGFTCCFFWKYVWAGGQLWS